MSQNRKLRQNELAGLIEPDRTVYIAGSSGEPSAFVSELLKTPQRTAAARVLMTFVPGINPIELSQFHPTATVTGLFMQPGFATAQRDGRFRALTMSYAGFVRHLHENVDINLAVMQVSPPDRLGQCSLGPAVEFMPTVLTKSQRRLALINHSTPMIPGSFSVPYDSFDYVCEVDTPLPEYATSVDSETAALAQHVASLIDDGSMLQLGLGKVPSALTAALTNHRNLRLHSGMLSDGFLDLASAGALDLDFEHLTCVLVGSKQFYELAAEFDPLHIRGCEFTHNASVLAGFERFVAVNSALEVDLFGQCNLEHANGSAVSGIGGAPDFARAARLSRGGRSIIALNARHRNESRIVPAFAPPSIASLARADVDYVITEFGIARLDAASVHERAERLIEVAAPEFREELARRWIDISARL